jgi:CRP-like cAMP-binding protein
MKSSSVTGGNASSDEHEEKRKTKVTMNHSVKLQVENHSFFRGVKPEHLEAILKDAAEVSVDANRIIFREGEPANRFYLIRSGRVALEAHDPAGGTALIQELGVGDALGWSWLYPPFLWHFQARTTEPTELVVLNGAHLLVAAERDPAFGYALVKRVSQVVIQRLQAARKRLVAQQLEAVMEG